MNIPNSLSFFYPLGTGLQMLGYALMIGGMLSIGAFAAPVIFKSVARPEAGDILTTIFRRYDNVLVGALIMIMVGEAMRILTTPGGIQLTGALHVIRYAVLAGTVLLLSVSIFKVNSDLENMHKSGVGYGATAEGQQFLKTHKLSENLYKIEMMGAVILVILTPFL